MDKRIVRYVIVALILASALAAPQTARAQNPLEPTQIEVGTAAQSDLGGLVTVQAVLADSQGHPISGAHIFFTAQAKFLGKTSDVVLAEAVTNAKGQAVAQFSNNLSGPLRLTAAFRGDAQYAPSNATIQPAVAGEQQVYSEHVGVDIPGFNVPPISAPKSSLNSSERLAGFVQGLWPAMNGWPVAAILFLVWSMYLLAVTFVFRVSAAGGEAEKLPPLDERSSL